MTSVGQTRRNFATTVIGFVLSIGIGIWFTPFLVHQLGPAAYGLIPLATTIVSYFSIITQTLSASLNRNLTFALEHNDPERASVAFGSALAGAGALAFLLAVPLAGVAWFSTSLFDVPPGAETATRLLFAFVAAAFVLSVLSTPFQGIIFSRNRLDLSNISAAIQTITRVALTIALFVAFTATVVNAATAILASAVIGIVLSMVFARRAAPHLAFFTFAYEAKEFRSISGIASKVLIMQIGTILVGSSELVLANKLFGAHLAGHYAAVSQWSLFLRNGATSVAVLCVPTILTLYARSQPRELVSYTRTAMKFMAICVALPAGYLCGLSDQILHVWLGPDFVSYWPLMVVQIAPIAITSTVVPLYTISLAADRVMLSGLIQLVTGAIGVAIALLIGAHSALGILGVAGAVGLSLAIKELVFLIPYAASNIEQPRATFYPPMLVAAALFGISCVGAIAIGKLFVFHDMLGLAIAGFSLAIGYCVAAYFLLDRDEQAMVRAFVSTRTIKAGGA
ncbi:lipopolysaccharide biosynthesis protein [Sphingomonas sp. RT2P30]